MPSDKPISTYRKNLLSALDNLSEPPTLDQFMENPRKLLPCQRLIVRIVEDALDCLMGNSVGGNCGGTMLLCYKGKVALETQRWIMSESELPLSFIWCCNSLGWEYPQIRKHMMKSANIKLMDLAKTVSFFIWKNNKSKATAHFRGVMELRGRRIDMGKFPTSSAASRALQREYSLRTS